MDAAREAAEQLLMTAPEARFSHNRPNPVKRWRSDTEAVQMMAHQASAPQNTAATRSPVPATASLALSMAQ